MSSNPKLNNFNLIVDYNLPDIFNRLEIVNCDLTKLPPKEFTKLVRLIKYHLK